MNTPKRAVKRRSTSSLWSKGKRRPVVVIVYPDGLIGLRLLGLRREETMVAARAYAIAAADRVAYERAFKAKKKKARKG